MSTKRKNWMYKVFLVFSLILCVTVACLFTTNRVQAKDLKDAFSVDLEVASVTADICTILVTVENNGKDWEGTVRLIPEEERGSNTAYDTIISLPQGSKKQFEVKIFKNSMAYISGDVTLSLINKKNEFVVEEFFPGGMAFGMNSVCMGILSDAYSSLTYLDLSGNKISYWNNQYPVKLLEVKADAITKDLESMQILVIDNFNTDIMSDEEVQEIERWIEDGGLLLVGTGAYAEDTLSTLGDTFLGVECYYVSPPMSGGITGEYGYVIDLNQLYIADLLATNQQRLFYSSRYYSNALEASYGMGAVAVVPYSFTELGQQDADFFEYMDRETYARNVLDELLDSVSARYNMPDSNRNNNTENLIMNFINIIGNVNSNLNFGVLRLIVLAYVIIIGPVVYLILKVHKKREWYWGVVPAITLLFVIIVFLSGRGFTVLNTRAYSVAVENLADVRKDKTYLYAFDASHDEWSVRMSEEYDFASRLSWQYYDNGGDYAIHVVKEGERLSLGIDPEQSFEDSYYILGKKQGAEKKQGSLLGEDIETYAWDIGGSVYNDTEYDFDYFAVIKDDELYVYKDLPAGKECDLSDKDVLFYGYASYGVGTNDYLYDFLYDIDEKQSGKISALAALGLGVAESYANANKDSVIILGVTTDTEKTVDDLCKELAYKCVYQVQ